MIATEAAKSNCYHSKEEEENEGEEGEIDDDWWRLWMTFHSEYVLYFTNTKMQFEGFGNVRDDTSFVSTKWIGISFSMLLRKHYITTEQWFISPYFEKKNEYI